LRYAWDISDYVCAIKENSPMQRTTRYALLIACLFLLALPIFAQDDAPADVPTPEPLPTAQVDPVRVVAQAEDGLPLRGDLYIVDPNRPTVLLLHQLYTTRRSWADTIPFLLGAHYNVLAVDLRGYGITGGRLNWQAAIGDVQTWLNWLRLEGGVRGDAISIMGSSMGSALAVRGCAQDIACRTAIAISPGREYYGVNILEALAEGMAGRRTLIIYAERDRYPALGMPDIIEAAPEGTLEIIIQMGNTHGMALLQRDADTLYRAILGWLAQHGG
jgi:pimeloyl-ACP methyl ester carboxylesterase